MNRTLRVEKVGVDTLHLDPNNARKHGARNLSAIKGSLLEFGQIKPIVVRNDIVIAGNGTLTAARMLGWEMVDITRADHLSHTQAMAYALADNKTSELAEWDDEILRASLDALLNDGFAVEDIGFDIDDIPGLGYAMPEVELDDKEGKESAESKFILTVHLGDKLELDDLKTELSSRGLIVKEK